MTIKKPELLLPAGSLNRLKTAILYGADAVYAGMPSVSLRNKTSFSLSELQQGIDFAHQKNKKVYLAVNLFTHNSDIPKLETFVEQLKTLRPDGVIVADAGVFAYIQEQIPDLPLHISTQANVCSALTVKYWKKQGADLCVLGRETPLAEIAEIRNLCPDIRLEMFVHGALCISYSGRCLLSNFMTGRSANKGNCAHSCRWKYKLYLEEQERPGDLMEITEDEHGTYIMNSKDLCLLPRLNDILPLNLDSFKIEGRNKSEYYTAIAAHTYRYAIDSWFENKDSWDSDPFMREIATLQSRGYTVGFLDGNAGPEAHNYTLSASNGDWRYAGLITECRNDSFVLEVKHKIVRGMTLEIVSPFQFEPISFTVADFYDFETNKRLDEVSSGHLGQSIVLPAGAEILQKITPLTVVRTKITP